MLQSCLLPSQTKGNIDLLNGFKKFKFQSSPKSILGPVFEGSELNGRLKRYKIDAESPTDGYDYNVANEQIKMVSLSYFDEKLFVINFWTFETLENYVLKQNGGIPSTPGNLGAELNRLFGSFDHKKTEEGILGKETTFTWETQNILVQFVISNYNLQEEEVHYNLIFTYKPIENKVTLAKYEH